MKRVIVRRPGLTACGPKSCSIFAVHVCHCRCSFAIVAFLKSLLISKSLLVSCFPPYPSRSFISTPTHNSPLFLMYLFISHLPSKAYYQTCSRLIAHTINPKYALYVLVVPFLLRPVLQQPFAHATSRSHRLWKDIDSMDGPLRIIGEPTKL